MSVFKKIFGGFFSQVQVGGNNCSQVQVNGNIITQSSITGDNSACVQFNEDGNNVIIVNGQCISGGDVIYSGVGKKHRKIAIDKSAKSFSKIQASGPFNIIYETSDEYGINVDASDEMLEKITVYVKNDTLYIEPYDSFINKNGKITITVKAPFIKNIFQQALQSLEQKHLLYLLKIQAFNLPAQEIYILNMLYAKMLILNYQVPVMSMLKQLMLKIKFH